MRDLFVATSHVLVLRGVLKPEQVAQFKGGPGYRNVAFEVLGFATLFRGEWATVGPASGLQLSELDEAERLSDQMLLALGLRERALSSGRGGASSVHSLAAMMLTELPLRSASPGATAVAGCDGGGP